RRVAAGHLEAALRDAPQAADDRRRGFRTEQPPKSPPVSTSCVTPSDSLTAKTPAVKLAVPSAVISVTVPRVASKPVPSGPCAWPTRRRYALRPGSLSRVVPLPARTSIVLPGTGGGGGFTVLPIVPPSSARTGRA